MITIVSRDVLCYQAQVPLIVPDLSPLFSIMTSAPPAPSGLDVLPTVIMVVGAVVTLVGTGLLLQHFTTAFNGLSARFDAFVEARPYRAPPRKPRPVRRA